jgi:hypothetical protein
MLDETTYFGLGVLVNVHLYLFHGCERFRVFRRPHHIPHVVSLEIGKIIALILYGQIDNAQHGVRVDDRKTTLT